MNFEYVRSGFRELKQDKVSGMDTFERRIFANRFIYYLTLHPKTHEVKPDIFYLFKYLNAVLDKLQSCAKRELTPQEWEQELMSQADAVARVAMHGDIYTGRYLWNELVRTVVDGRPEPGNGAGISNPLP